LIEGIDAEHLIADKGYDSDAVIRQARSQGMQAQIPPRKGGVPNLVEGLSRWQV
jgi:hypothetical protein